MIRKFIVIEFDGDSDPTVKLPVPFNTHREAFCYMLDRMSEYNGMTREEMMSQIDVKEMIEGEYSFEDFYRTGIFQDGGQLLDQCRTWRYWDIRTVTSDQDEISFGTVEPDDIHFSIC